MFFAKLKAPLTAILAILLGAGTLVYSAGGQTGPSAKPPNKLEILRHEQETPTRREQIRQGKPGAKHDFTNLQRLAKALENYNYPDNAATMITVWCQDGGKGTSCRIADTNTLDVAIACYMGVNGDYNTKRLDLQNVAIVSANGRSIRFVNLEKEVAAKRPIGVTVQQGDLVAVLERVKGQENEFKEMKERH
jgi:hypothetical protein